LSVSDGNNVSGDISRHITSLSLNNGESGKGTTSEGFVHLGRTLQKTGMEIKHISGVSLTTGGSSQQEGHLSVSYGLLGKIVVDDKGVLSVISEIFTDSTSGIRSQILNGGSFRGSSGNDDGVLHGTLISKNLDEIGHGRSLLSDSNVDTEQLFVNISGIKVLLLVKDGINSNGGLTSLTISNDKFSLSSSNGNQTINGL